MVGFVCCIFNPFLAKSYTEPVSAAFGILSYDRESRF
jgi:hypothetical protein